MVSDLKRVDRIPISGILAQVQHSAIVALAQRLVQSTQDRQRSFEPGQPCLRAISVMLRAIMAAFDATRASQ